MLPPVIAGVDGSAESLASAEWAAREAVRRDRPLRLGHARNWHPRQEDGEMATAAPLKAADEHFPDERGNGSTRTAYRDVILGVDLADPCDEVIGFAFQEARLRRSRLKVVHVRQHPSPTGLGPGEPGLMSGPERAGEWLGFLTAVLQVWRDKCPDVEVTETVAGRPQSALLRIASGAGLLVGRRTTDRPTGPRPVPSPTSPSTTSAAPWPSYPMTERLP